MTTSEPTPTMLKDFLMTKIRNFTIYCRKDLQYRCKTDKVKTTLDQLEHADVNLVLGYIITSLMPYKDGMRDHMTKWLADVDVEVVPEDTKEKLLRYLQCFCDIVSAIR